MTLKDRLLLWLDSTDPDRCWVWTGTMAGNYGSMDVGGKKVKPHRLSYQEFVGPIPDGAVVMHKCDNPLCCNPYHLTVGTQGDNVADMVSKKRGSFGYSNRKLTDEQVNSIRTSERKANELAEQFGVNKTTVYRIKSGVRWAQKEQ